MSLVIKVVNNATATTGTVVIAASSVSYLDLATVNISVDPNTGTINSFQSGSSSYALRGSAGASATNVESIQLGILSRTGAFTPYDLRSSI